MLPHEAEAQADIASRFANELQAMTDLHNAVMGTMLSSSWKIGKPGHDAYVIYGMMVSSRKPVRRFAPLRF